MIALLGGAKVSDKVKCIEKLLPLVDNILLGGAMAYPFLASKGFQVGKSLCSKEDQALATILLRQDKGQKIILPLDHVGATTPDAQASEIITTLDSNVPANIAAFDIGLSTIKLYESKLKLAHTIFWNGPMGFFEKPLFAQGTKSLSLAMSEMQNSFRVVGGGDSVAAVQQFHLADKFSHVSSGGGASLEYIEEGDLPGIKALKFGVK